MNEALFWILLLILTAISAFGFRIASQIYLLGRISAWKEMNEHQKVVNRKLEQERERLLWQLRGPGELQDKDRKA